MSGVAETLGGVMLLCGSALCVIGGIGLLRLPDFYTRTHANGLTDTLGATLILGGLVGYAGPGLVALKLVLIAMLFYATSPTGTHALVKAAYSRGVRAAPSEADEPAA